jgi:hypothetical protein
MLATGCASSGPESAEKSQAQSPKQAITVIRSDTFQFDWGKEIRPVRADLERCAADAIERHFPDLRLPFEDEGSRRRHFRSAERLGADGSPYIRLFSTARRSGSGSSN